ncbi:hypothetical protein P7D22_08725 [Lichenihabitans sp. Uapishka_5]|uniref:alpha-glutamyl/putrescinyl thymine pyrophosphorylase clade 3 protein n=1 Tax=Lichenihabitans sp. Uapishka_5 TaxID=3037302 RepID=UPI0029E7E354|nr:hypothetical protein [Lichenihabitans sp. Uapishka_5]MDX7951260.1 hypothetical protein [Lichenihabitans sp. Uapishka_5]
MWPSWVPEHKRLTHALRTHAGPLPGLADPRALDVLAWQFVASLRRESYYRQVQAKSVSAERADPNDPSFNAERAVAYHVGQGDADEAGWLIFLMTYFARPPDSGWRRLQDVYGRLGKGRWDWVTVSADPGAFEAWLAENWMSVGGKFGNHRKYESLRPDSNRPMAAVVAAYVRWIGPGGHARFYADAVRRTGNDPHTIFDAFYFDLRLPTFGRLAKFDYLSLIGRYGIAPIAAGSAYLKGATGPANGARLLLDGRRDGPSSIERLQADLDALDGDIGVGMAVMEDALCNWQKSPTRFVHFKG